VIVPATPVPDIELPDPPETTTPLSGIGVDVCSEPEATVNVTVARVPLPMTLEFAPVTTHLVLPAMLEHVAPLLAATALAPAVTLTLEMSEDEYPIVHSISEGCAPPDAVIVTGRVTTAPGAALPDPMATATDCATACVAARANNTHVMLRIRLDFEKEPEEFIKSVHNRCSSRSKHTPGVSAEWDYLWRIRSSMRSPSNVVIDERRQNARIKARPGEFFGRSATTGCAHSHAHTRSAAHARKNTTRGGSRR